MLREVPLHGPRCGHDGPALVPLAEAYLTLRRSLGYSLVTQGGALLDFARYADETAEAGPLTLDLAVQWAKSSKKPCPSNLSRRLTIVRGFAESFAGVEPGGTEIPPIRMFGPWARRAEPHIYSDTEISDMLKAMSHLRPRRGLRPLTYVTLFSLLVSTGLPHLRGMQPQSRRRGSGTGAAGRARGQVPEITAGPLASECHYPS